MRVLSLFAGIGGFDLGLQRAGFDIAAQVEIDSFCTKILEKHWPEVERYGDIKTLDEFPAADIVSAGFPCQDISSAGRGAGLSGDRSRLFWEAMRAIRMVRPKYAILENVAALRSRGLDRVLGALAESGYDTEWDCLPASAFGAPHERDRVFVVAYSPSVEFHGSLHSRKGWPGSADCGHDVADPICFSGQRWRDSGYVAGEKGGIEGEAQERKRRGNAAGHSRQDVCNIANEEFPDWAGGEVGQPCPLTQFERSGCNGKEREVECDFRGVAHGVSNRVHRLKALGNAVVPQIPEWIGRQIAAVEARP